MQTVQEIVKVIALVIAPNFALLTAQILAIIVLIIAQIVFIITQTTPIIVPLFVKI